MHGQDSLLPAGNGKAKGIEQNDGPHLVGLMGWLVEAGSHELEEHSCCMQGMHYAQNLHPEKVFRFFT